MGISYGGYLAWQWGVQYPEFMRGIVPLTASPFSNAGRRSMQDVRGAGEAQHLQSNDLLRIGLGERYRR